MDSLAVLEVAIGIILVYLVLSLVCTALMEAVIAWRQLKGRNLRKAIVRMLGSDSLADEIYAHPDVAVLCGPTGRPPSYIPSDVFADSVLDIATNSEWRRSGGLPSVLRQKCVELSTASDGDDVRARQTLGTRLVGFIDEAGGDLELTKKRIETWFDRTGDRSKGWFKRKLSLWLLAIGFVVAALVNADTVQIFDRLSEDPTLREAAVSMAEERLKQEDALEGGSTIEYARNEIGEIAPFIGWSDDDPFVAALGGEGNVFVTGLMKALGLVLTAFAISLGAPFWFELLQKLVNIRASVKAGRADGGGGPPTDGDPGGAGPTGGAAGGESAGPAYSGPMAGFSPTAASVNIGNAYWLAKAAALAYETNPQSIRDTVASWGLSAHVFESDKEEVKKHWQWKGVLPEVDTQGFVAADDNAIIVAFRGTEPTTPADVITDLKFKLVDAGRGEAGMVHRGFKDALDAVWDDVEAKIRELGGNQQTVWFTGHSLGGALAVLAASRYEVLAREENDVARRDLDDVDEKLMENDEDDAELIARRVTALASRMGRAAGVYTIGQPRVGDDEFSKHLDQRLANAHIRIINNRDIVPRVPIRAMDYEHSGTVLYFDEFGRLHRDPGLWLRLLDTVVISRAEIEKAKEGVADHAAPGYVDLLDRARSSDAIHTRLALS